MGSSIWKRCEETLNHNPNPHLRVILGEATTKRDTLHMSLLGELTGPELAYTHTAQWLSSVYYQLIQDTDEGFTWPRIILRDQLRYEAVPGETIYPTNAP